MSLGHLDDSVAALGAYSSYLGVVFVAWDTKGVAVVVVPHADAKEGLTVDDVAAGWIRS